MYWCSTRDRAVNSEDTITCISLYHLSNRSNQIKIDSKTLLQSSSNGAMSLGGFELSTTGSAAGDVLLTLQSQLNDFEVAYRSAMVKD